LTFSRGAIIALLLGVVYLIYFDKKLLYGSILILFLAVMWVQIREKDFLNFLPGRFAVNRVIQDKTNGRAEIWIDYFNYAKLKDYLIGVGYNASPQSILYQKPLLIISPLDSRMGLLGTEASRLKIFSIHSFIFYILFVFGIFGFFICFYLSYLIYKNIKNNIALSLTTRRIYLSLYISIMIALASERLGDMMFFPILMSHFPAKSIFKFRRDRIS
jgi:O-antigen ligase